MTSEKKSDAVKLLARVFIAPLFLIPGYGKIVGFAGSVAYATAFNVPFPEIAIVLAIIIEIGAGLMLLFGWKTSWAALALLVFAVVTALFFHSNFADQAQMVSFLKNFAIAGGLMYVKMMGAGAYSLDAKLKPKM